MTEKKPEGEKVIREYPRSTRMIEGLKVIGVGNLVLTNRRLIFLHQVHLSDWQVENIKKLSEGGDMAKVTEFALTLHKMNFEVPLASVVSAKMGLYSILPPRPCLRIVFRGAKKNQVKAASFMFTIPLLRGLSQFEITDVLSWMWAIRRAVRQVSNP